MSILSNSDPGENGSEADSDLESSSSATDSLDSVPDKLSTVQPDGGQVVPPDLEALKMVILRKNIGDIVRAINNHISLRAPRASAAGESPQTSSIPPTGSHFAAGSSQAHSFDSNRQTLTGNSAQKRKRGKLNGTGQDDSGDEDEEDREPSALKVPKLGNPNAFRFACPYYRQDPLKYGSERACLGPGWPTVHRVKSVRWSAYRRDRGLLLTC